MLRSDHRDQLLAGSLPEGPAVFHWRTAENETVQGRPDGNRIALVRKQVDNFACWREIIYIQRTVKLWRTHVEYEILARIAVVFRSQQGSVWRFVSPREIRL